MGAETFALPYAFTLVFLCVFERSLNALLAMFLYGTPWKRLASQQVLVKNVDLMASVGSVFVTTFVRGVLYLVSWWVFFLAVFALFASIYVMYEENADGVVAFVNFYNASVGPWLSKVVLAPLVLLDLIFRALLPIYNTIMYWFKALVLDVILPIVVDDLGVFLKMCTVLLDLFSNLAISIKDFANSFDCEGVACLAPERHVYDGMSWMGNVRQLGALSVSLVSNFCGFIAAPVDMLLFPLMDYNLSSCVHNLINALYQFFFAIPHSTYVRCKLAQNDTFHDMLCTPDSEPFFTFLVAAISDLGLCVDNWLNVALVILEEIFTGARTVCDALPQSLPPHVIMADSLFGGNLTAVVGLTQWMYAVTDGHVAVYTGHTDAEAKLQRWAHSVDPSHGLAAVVYGGAGDLDASSLSKGRTAGSLQTTAMLGCKCVDVQSGGIQVECSILPMSGVPSNHDDYYLQALFPGEDVPYQLGSCANVQLSVHSARWSLTRYESRTVTYGVSTVQAVLPSGDCVSRGTCREVDALVYVQPKCGEGSGVSCLPGAHCFPFCMAARVSGSANNNLVLVGADRWRSGYTLVNQDCALSTGTVQTTHANLFPTGTQTVVSAPPNLLTLNARTTVAVGSESRQCRPAQRLASLVDRPTTTSTSLRLDGQPFVIAGETLLTEKSLGRGGRVVAVERLSGDQKNVFTLARFNQDLPASPSLAVQSQEFKLDDPSHVLVPFAAYTSKMPAVTTRNYVLYASNPALDCFRAQFDYCENRRLGLADLPKIGFLLRSSYAPLRVYRVRAFAKCAANSCGSNLVRFAQLKGFNDATFTPRCDQAFNASITSLEYVNEDNVALVVHYSKEGEYDVDLARGTGPHSGYATYWLNPNTMQIKDLPWTTAVPESNYGVLCPAMQRMPRVGTMLAELVNGGVFFTRLLNNVFLYTHGLWSIWRAGGLCPAPFAALHHSVLLNCGDEYLSMEDFFDSLDDVSAHFWHTLTLLAQTAADVTGVVDNPISNLLQGMSSYGERTVEVWAIGQAVFKMSSVPIMNELKTMVASIQNTMGSRGAMLNAMFRVNVGGLAWARFSYKAVTGLVLTVTKNALRNEPITEAKMWGEVWSTLYDLHPYYTATVTERNRKACAGLRTMFAIDNPFAKLAYYQCMAAGELADDIFGFALTMVVDVPMVKCVCKDAAASGTNMRSFVQNTCAPNLPPSIRPLLYMIVNQIQGPSSGFRQLACNAVINVLKTDLQGTLNGWFEAEEQAFAALSNIVDSLMINFDDKSGQCLDYDGSPHVVVVMPQPADYFSLCAKTTLCKAKCSRLWAAFQARVRTPVELPSIQVTTESYFFPGQLDVSAMLTNATAVAEVAPDGLCSTDAPRDYALAIAQYSSAGLSSRVYCVPQHPGGTVYPLLNSGFGPLTLPGFIVSVAYTNASATTLALLLSINTANRVYLASANGLIALPSVESRLSKTQKLVQISNLWVIHGTLIIDVVARKFQDNYPVADELHFAADPLATSIVWSVSSINIAQFARDYWYTREHEASTYLFLPKRGSLPPYRIGFAKTGTFYQITTIAPLTNLFWSSYESSLSTCALSTTTTSANALFAVSQSGWDWLKHVRLDGTGALNSLPVTTTLMVRGNCDEISCEGCPDALTQRLCLAYNKCALMNCVGTPINMKRPLCGMGGTLKFFGDILLQTFNGAWTMLVEVIYTLVELSVKPLPGVNVAFPDDAFLGYMCVAKDANANLISIITSTINSLMQLSQTQVTYLYQGATNVDNNADAMLTVTMTAVTGFIHQTLLLPIYIMGSSYQILMCQVNGILALFDQTGFTVRLESAELVNASAALSGKCLTLTEMTMARYPAQNKNGLGYQVSTFLQNVMNREIISRIDMIIHMVDGALAYMQGWFRALGILIMTQNMAQCNPPEHLLKDIATCACGDTPLAISKKTETFLDLAHWCSGTLGMVDGANRPFVVFNPYSYAELQQAASATQAYLDCASASYQCTPPTMPEFDFQGVTLLNVIVKCRENFAKKQWDPMAHVLYDEKKWGLFKTRIPLTFSHLDPYGVKNCLVNNPDSNAQCLELYLNNSQDLYDTYFAYHRAPTETRPEYVDACIAFDGPGKKQQSPEFANCVEGVNQEQCTLPAHLWTPDSQNSVPVAHEHVVTYTGSQPDSLIFLLYNRAQSLVQSALDQAEAVWSQQLQNNVDYDFFSAEGDIIHQTLDCIFMGPYSRMDYWPIPHCGDNLDCPEGPYWARDELSGASRSVDSPSCVNTTSLPYTCGSPARKALVKYFVREYLATANRGNTNGSLLQQAVRAQIASIRAQWSATNKYGCLCADSTTHSHACCANATDSELLPSSLNAAYTDLKSDHVMHALSSQFDDFYDHILQSQLPWAKYLEDVAPGHAARYDWSESTRAVEEARFHTKEPVIEYAAGEVLSPLKPSVPHTLWDVCHASLKQVFWTMPMYSNGSVKGDMLETFETATSSQRFTTTFRNDVISQRFTTATSATNPNDAISQRFTTSTIRNDAISQPFTTATSATTRNVAISQRFALLNLIQRASQHSPLFRHYIARYVPSDSLVCSHDPVTAPPSYVSFEDYVHATSTGEATVLDGDVLGTIPSHHKDRFALGAHECFCGWQRVGGLCQAPAQGCEDVNEVTGRSDCRYHDDMEPMVVNLYVEGVWHCPEMDLSVHWGLLDADAQDAWMRGQPVTTTRSRDVLRYGRAGLRVGNVEDLRREGKSAINPKLRAVNKSLHALPNCHRPPPPLDLIDEFIDDLFPVSQGVEESGAGAYCLRMTVEVARLTAVELYLGGDSLEATKQREVADAWKKKCGAQLQLLHLCVSLDVFFRQPSNLFTRCEHFTFVPGALYVTPECLVAAGDAFYDPCRCMDCTGNRTVMVDLTYLVNNPSCKLRFDPREILQDGPIGWWGEASSDAKYDAFKQHPHNHLRSDFAHTALNEPDNFGNVEDGHAWWSAEGFMGSNSEYCDMISDYWPEEWDHPVGYHVSMPCDAGDTAYRSFHKAFALDDSQQAPVLRYQHDALRDAHTVDSHFGEAGLCRTTMLGMPLTETNTMRYATRVPLGLVEDYTVYSSQASAEPQQWTDWAYSASSAELPWPDYTVNTADKSSATHSIGLLPNMPPVGADTYPHDFVQGMWDVGPAQDLSGSRPWGEDCSDYSLKTCLNDCPSGYACRGRVCSGSAGVSCTTDSACRAQGYGACRGVCMDASHVQCVKHSECAAGLMCSGVGTCLPLRISVQNAADTLNYTFQTYTRSSQCGALSRNFSLLGGSYWGYVTNDVLRAHGMCSYRDWYKYTQLFQRCTVAERGSYFELDPFTCRLQDLDSLSGNTTFWWNYQSARPDVMYMHPSNCDRDYERLDGFTACAPLPLDNNLRNTQTSVFTQVQYDKFARTHTEDGTVLLAKMPQRSSAKYGFLGLPSVTTDAQFGALQFAACSTIKQCFPYPFTHLGAQATRRRMSPASNITQILYNHDDTFQCGSVGYVLNQQCVLDADVLPLYKFLCLEPNAVRSQCTATVFPARQALCAALTSPYPAGYAYVESNVDALRQLFYAFETPVNPVQYLDMAQCAASFYAYLQARPLYRTLYYPFDFALFEIPFDWFFQCFVMSDTQIDHAARRPQDCLAYQRRAAYTKETYEPASSTGEDVMTFLRYVRGGYTLSQVLAYEQASKNLADARITAAIDQTVRTHYAGNDTSYPRCSERVTWNIGPSYTYVSPYRAIIHTYYDTGTCHLQWLESQIATQAGLDSFNWYAQLSTPDPAARLPQTPGGRTLLTGIRDYIHASTGTAPAEIILGSKTMESPPETATRREAFVFDATPPAAPTQALYDTVSSFAQPLPQPEDADAIVVFENLNVPHVCAFDDPYDDPAQTGVQWAPGQCATKQRRRANAKQPDSLRQCGTVWCSEVPLYYKVNGMYGCGYYPDAFDIVCTEDAAPTCANDLLLRLYQDVLANYDPPLIDPLPVQSFPWFSPDTPWQNFTFQLGSVLDYLGNIMPDKEKSLMCQVGDTQLDLMQCNNQNYATLRDHVNQHYFHDGFPIVPSNQQLEWDVDASVLQQGAIFAFASTSRDPAQTYLKNLFTDATACKGATTQNLRVCWQSGAQWNTVNPWHLGNWNPFEQCDVKYTSRSQGGDEIFDTRCLSCDSTSPFYTSMPNRAYCEANDRRKASFGGVPTSDEFGYLDYNLCHHALTQDPGGCLHDQSLLGGFDGLNIGGDPALTRMTETTSYSDYAYSVSPNMYEPSSWQIPGDFEGGLFAGTNPLLSGEDAPYGFLRIPPGEIGVHHAQFSITTDGNFSTLKLHRLPLHPKHRKDDVLAQAGPLPVSSWVPALQSTMQAEHLSNQILHAVQFQNIISASCPLRRYAFYGSSHPTFNPVMPSPLRAQHLFKSINGDRLAHPLMTPTGQGAHLGSYTTHNGFCFCPVVSGIKQPQCLRQIFGDQSECSLINTVRLLRADGEFGQSVAFKPKGTNLADKTCTMMLDWPNLPNPLRDGSAPDVNWGPASDVEGKKCHVLDRLRPFQYKYASVPTFRTSSTASHLTNACQTRRVATIGTRPITGRCVTSSRDGDYNTLRCEDSNADTQWARRSVLTPRETVQRRNFQRRHCSRCSPPPLFQSEKGHAIRAESSFGRHYRHSAERALAQDLRETLCTSLGQCPQFNATAWQPGAFMRAYLTDPKSLFAAAPPNPIATPVKSTADDSSLWEKPWVFCPDLDALKTGQCKGAVSRRQWVKGKTTICPRMIKQLSKEEGDQDPLARTSFCKLDNSTDKLCQAITQARQVVMEANCIARGKNVSCLPQPWVYHPANYDPSNQEWNYRTVLSFYRLINASACPLTAQELDIINANRVFQRSCPANTVVFFEAVIKVLRILVAKLAMLGAAVISMFMRMCVLLIATANPFWADTVRTAKADIASDWAWVKKEASAMIDSITDLMADALFTSGQLGRGLLDFLNRVCDGLNEMYEWLMKQWCEHIQKYLANFLTVVRKGFGIVASGFEILQDFMDEMLMGVLPLSFMAKYGDKAFQKRMVEKYSQPTRTGSNALGAVSSAERAAQKAAKQSGRLKMAGKASGVLTIAFMAFDAYQIIQGSLLYPDNFTLFDFTDVFDRIDAFLDFLVNERTCYERQVRIKYNLDQRLFTCINTRLSAVDPSNADAMSVDATPCWAQASASLGQSTLFSCNTGSTCCKDAFCTEFAVCDTCPSPTAEAVSRYGCNSLTQKCQCLVDQSRYSNCMANGECSGGWCVLMTSLDGLSYGTVPCDQCPGGHTFCMVSASGPGRCSCLMDQGSSRSLCAERSGTQTIADGSKLCAYARDATLQDASFSYEYESLAMTPCIQALTVVCSVVYYPDSSYVRMSVAIPPIRLAGRRLLEFSSQPVDEFEEALSWPGWDDTAPPCNLLHRARSHQNATLGVLEEVELRKCAHWRRAGRDVARQLNLTHALKDTFLMSADDFASAVSTKEAFLAVVTHPWLLFKAALYHPWLKPLKAAMAVVEAAVDQLAHRMRTEDAWLDEVVSDLPDDSFVERRRNRTRGLDVNLPQKTPKNATKRRKNGRKLMGLQEELSAVQGLMVSVGKVSKDVPSVERVSEAYTRGPFHWPPYQTIYSDCQFGDRLVDVTYEVFVILGNYYTHWDRKRPEVDRSFRAALPQFKWNASKYATGQNNVTKRKSWSSYVFHGLLGLVGATPADTLVFFQGTEPWTLRWLWHTLTKCDLAVVQSCSGHKRDLVMSIGVFVVFYFAFVALGNALGIPYLSIWFVLSSPTLLVWYVYTVGPGCFPLAPTCLLEDVIHAWRTLLPETMYFPKKLLCNELYHNRSFVEDKCLRSCGTLGFTGWMEPITFGLCDADPGWCKSLANSSFNIPVIDGALRPFKESIMGFSHAVHSTDVQAYRVCAWVTGVTAVPFAAILISAGLMAGSIVLGFVQLGPVFFSLVAQSVAYHRTR